MAKPISVVVVDDDELVAAGICLLCSREPDVTILGSASDSTVGLKLIAQFQPDVAIVDLGMPGLDGIGVITRLRQDKLLTRVIILTGRSDETLFYKAIEAGAEGYLLKCSNPDELGMAIRSVSKGKMYITSEMVHLLPKSPHHAAPVKVTPRQREVLQLVAEGRTSKEIAMTLGMAPKTVENHRTQLMRSLGVSNSAQLIATAINNHLVLSLSSNERTGYYSVHL